MDKTPLTCIKVTEGFNRDTKFSIISVRSEERIYFLFTQKTYFRKGGSNINLNVQRLVAPVSSVI